MSPGIGRRAAAALCAGLFCLLTLILVDGALYLRARASPGPAVRARSALRPVPGIPAATLRRLGWLEAEQSSSFIRFPRAKKDGVVRIGCLGDSFTAGAEAGAGEDFPSLLQRLFRTRGYARVEVLNFGSGGYGFQQAYTLWDEVARHYNLDYILMGPGTLFPDRDTTFDHSSYGKSALPPAAYLNARRVLDGTGLRLVEVAGESVEERTAVYRGWIPRWRYLRYDRRAPAFLTCLLPRGRELRNPFYYQRDYRAEATAIYGRMLGAMLDSGARVVLGLYDPAMVEALRRPQLHAARLIEVRQPPYRAFKNHHAPAGNRLVAEQYFAMLTGRRRVSLPLIGYSPLRRGVGIPGGAPFRDLCAYERVSVGAEGAGGWRLFEVMRNTGIRYVPSDHFRAQGLRSLLILKPGGRPLPQAILYPLGIPLEEGQALVLRPASGPRAGQEVVLGRVALPYPGLNVGVVALGEVLRGAFPAYIDEDAVVSFPEESRLRRLFPGDLYLGGRMVLRATAADGAGRVRLQPPLRRFLQIYAPADILDSEPGGGGGTVFIELKTQRGRVLRLPLWRWHSLPGALAAGFSSPSGFQTIRKP